MTLCVKEQLVQMSELRQQGRAPFRTHNVGLRPLHSPLTPSALLTLMTPSHIPVRRFCLVAASSWRAAAPLSGKAQAVEEACPCDAESRADAGLRKVVV